MNEKGFFRNVRRMALGRNAEERETHEKNLKRLETELNGRTQEVIDGLASRYENEEVRMKIMNGGGGHTFENFLTELKALQVALIKGKSEFEERRKQNQTSDIEDIGEEMKLWEKQMDGIINESEFRKLAEKYGVWGHGPVESVQKTVQGKIVRIHHNAA